MRNFSQTTTLENLQGRFAPLDSNIVFKGHVIDTKEYWKERGCFVAIYKAKEEKLNVETELELFEENEELFEDSGSAVAWAFTRI